MTLQDDKFLFKAGIDTAIKALKKAIKRAKGETLELFLNIEKQLKELFKTKFPK